MDLLRYVLIFLRFGIIIITSAGKAREGFRASCPEKKLSDTEGDRPWGKLVGQCPPMDPEVFPLDFLGH